MTHPLLTIIIPTFNRQEILAKTLRSIASQQSCDLSTVEVIVVDDGSTDKTKNVVEEFIQTVPFSLHYLHQSNSGQGNARNLGLSKAQGYIVLFIGDDIILDPYCLEEHLKVHRKYLDENIACLGFTTWHAELPVTPFMYFLEHGGPQFNYPKLEKEAITDWELSLREGSFWYFYTSNISLKRSLLLNKKFEHIYTSYGWEDIDFGYSLVQEKKLRILYDAAAKGWHWHEISEDSFRDRMHNVGKNALLFARRHPKAGVLPKGGKLLIFRIVTLKPVLACLHWLGKRFGFVQQWYYYALSKQYFLEGLRMS